MDVRKLMMNGVVDELCEEIGCKTDYQKLTLKAMIVSVFDANRKEYGVDTQEAMNEIRSIVFGNQMTSLETKVLELACFSWSNDVERYLCESTGYDGEIFKKIFDMINSIS